jgi:hypothetical protein
MNIHLWIPLGLLFKVRAVNEVGSSTAAELHQEGVEGDRG